MYIKKFIATYRYCRSSFCFIKIPNAVICRIRKDAKMFDIKDYDFSKESKIKDKLFAKFCRYMKNQKVKQ